MARRLREDPSGYTTAFTHPDPMDPNDRTRQKTQSRDGDYPYDSPTSYGGPIGTDDQGGAYQRSPDSTPPKPQHKKASDAIPYGEFGSAWEAVVRRLGTYEPGPNAPDAASLGYGSHGRLGDDFEIDIDSPGLADFVTAFVEPAEPVPSQTLFSLLGKLAPEVDLIDPEDGGSESDIYSEPESGHVYAPGAEEDPE